MAENVLVDVDAIADYIGLETVLADPVRTANVAVNVSLLAVGGRKYADVRDLERTLRLFGNANPPIHELLHSVADQLVDASGLTRRMI